MRRDKTWGVVNFDNPSLVVAAAVTSVVCAAARFLLAATHPAMSGLGRWAWASVLGACSALLFAAMPLMVALPSVPRMLLLSLPQVLVFLALLVAWAGFRQFLDRPPVPVAMHAAIVVAGLAGIVLSHAGPTLPIQTIIASTLIGLASAVIAWELLAQRVPRRVVMQATGGVYVLNAVVFLGRAAGIVVHGGTMPALQSDPATATALLWGLGFVVASTLGMVLMTGERLQEELDHQVSRDPLTGAFNRRAFALMAEKAMAHCRRQGKEMAVLAMDLDHFKQVNDGHGHAVGDRYLCRFVAVAMRMLRGEDVLCRFGGEEFIALLPETSAPQALAAAERLRAAFAAEIAADPALPVRTTVSIGIAEMGEGESLDSLLHRADTALYRAKHNGRNRCEPAEMLAAAVP